METMLIAFGVLIALVVLTSLFSKEKRPPSGNCRTCPEYRYCGGGRRGCGRRGEIQRK